MDRWTVDIDTDLTHLYNWEYDMKDVLIINILISSRYLGTQAASGNSYIDYTLAVI